MDFQILLMHFVNLQNLDAFQKGQIKIHALKLNYKNLQVFWNAKTPENLNLNFKFKFFSDFQN